MHCELEWFFNNQSQHNCFKWNGIMQLAVLTSPPRRAIEQIAANKIGHGYWVNLTIIKTHLLFPQNYLIYSKFWLTWDLLMPSLHSLSRALSSHIAGSFLCSPTTFSAFSLAASQLSIPESHFSASFWYWEFIFQDGVGGLPLLELLLEEKDKCEV